MADDVVIVSVCMQIRLLQSVGTEHHQCSFCDGCIKIICAAVLQYDPVMGHETKGRSEFENMINGFSKVCIGCCTSGLYVQLLTVHVTIFPHGKAPTASSWSPAAELADQEERIVSRSQRGRQGVPLVRMKCCSDILLLHAAFRISSSSSGALPLSAGG